MKKRKYLFVTIVMILILSINFNINSYAKSNLPKANEVKTVYDFYSKSDIDIFAKLVEAEATEADFESKCNVANVIWNRLWNEDFPDNIPDIVYQKENGVYQFSPISDGRFKKMKPNKDTYEAIEYTFINNESLNQATYFHSGNSNWHQKNLEFLFKDKIGHKFYKIKKGD